MSEPELKHLLERIKKVDAVVTAIAGELAEQRADIKEIQSFIQREFENAAAAARDLDKRLRVVEKQFQQHQDLDGAIVDHHDRLSALEVKVFPKLWPTLQRVVSVIGGLDDRYDIRHPLDHRKKDNP